MAHRDGDHEQAAREAAARQRLLAAGAATLPRMPWLARVQPPAAADLVRFALWRSQVGSGGRAGAARGHTGSGTDELVAALTLLPAARAEVDQTEAALLFTARAHGLSWAQISQAMGLGSPQAAQQRFGRITVRTRHPGGS